MIPPLQVPTLPVTRRDASRNLPWLQQFIKKWELSANRNDISRLLPLSPLGFGRYNSGGVTMPGLVRTLFALAAVGAVIAVPAGSIAAAQPAIPSPTAHQASAAAATNPWLALSAMTSSSGAASAAEA